MDSCYTLIDHHVFEVIKKIDNSYIVRLVDFNNQYGDQKKESITVLVDASKVDPKYMITTSNLTPQEIMNSFRKIENDTYVEAKFPHTDD